MQSELLERMPGGKRIFYRRRRAGRTVVVCGWLVLFALGSRVSAQPWECTPGLNCVDLRLRPTSQDVNVGEVVQVGVYAVADGSQQYPISGIDVILDWDPLYLRLLGRQDPCDDYDPCFECPPEDPPDVPATYNWGTSGFPYDCELDGLNYPCAGTPANDGDAFLTAWAQLAKCECIGGSDAGSPCDANEDCDSNKCGAPAYATTNGLHVTDFRFQVLLPGTTQVAMKAAADCATYTDGRCEFVESACCNPPTCTQCSFARTQVSGGPYPGSDALDSIGGPVTLNISACPPLTKVEAEGCRYIAVTPTIGPDTVALRVTGVNPPPPGDPNVSCISGYVQSNGTLGTAAVYRSPAQWGTVHLRGTNLRSQGSYNVQADCAPADPGTVLSSTLTTKLWRWGETNMDNTVDFVDIGNIVDGFRGVFWAMNRPCTLDSQCIDVPGSYHEKCDTAEGYCVRITVQNVDVYGGTGCTPDGVIDFVDITREVDAFIGRPYPCPVSCP